jgi:glycerate kinase
MNRRYLVVPDSFKGTFSASEVAQAIARGIGEAGDVADLCPAADGGEGTLEILLGESGGTKIEVDVHDALQRPIRAAFGLLAPDTALVEVAAASGLPSLAPAELDAERADTFGTGELISAAIETGAKTVLVAAGGSATTDGGRGAIEALRQNPKLQGVRLEVLCDVDTLYEDAARVFAPQKGADAAAVQRLTARLEAFAPTLERDPRGIPMGGCAGGLSGGLMGAFDAQLRPGAPFVLERLGFANRLAAADAAITGEGQIDGQSLHGKVVGTVAELCARAGRPLHVIAGRNALSPQRAQAAGIASISQGSTLEEIAAAGRSIARHGR